MNAKQLLFTFLLFFISSKTYPWSESGHRITALIAYDLLDNNTRMKILEDLRAHRYYESHFEKRIPNTIKKDQELVDRWLFSQIVNWPDLIKSVPGYMENKRNSWHSINEPVFLFENDRKAYNTKGLPINLKREGTGDLNKLSKNLGYNPNSNWNASQAFRWVDQLLVEQSGEAKAEALCWVFHIIGDIHQPLHSTALFNIGSLEEGDKGGNLLEIQSIDRGKPLALHSYWDRIPGKWNKDPVKRFKNDIKFAKKYIKAFGKSNGMTAEKTMEFEIWIKESNELAREVAYPPEILDAVKSIVKKEKEVFGWKNKAKVELSKAEIEAYKKKTKPIAVKRVISAGYRLSNYLTAVYKG